MGVLALVALVGCKSQVRSQQRDTPGWSSTAPTVEPSDYANGLSNSGELELRSLTMRPEGASRWECAIFDSAGRLHKKLMADTETSMILSPGKYTLIERAGLGGGDDAEKRVQFVIAAGRRTTIDLVEVNAVKIPSGKRFPAEDKSQGP